MPEINEEGQEKLLNSSVAIIGAGGLGCPVGLYLAGAGIGSILSLIHISEPTRPY